MAPIMYVFLGTVCLLTSIHADVDRYLEPAFLAGSTEQTFVEFHSIRHNDTLSKSEKETAVQRLVDSLGGDYPEKYKAWKAKKTTELNERIANLSEEAKTAYNTRKSIQEDSTLSQEQKKERLTELIGSMTDKTKCELWVVRNNGQDWASIKCRAAFCTIQHQSGKILSKDDDFWYDLGRDEHNIRKCEDY